MNEALKVRNLAGLKTYVALSSIVLLAEITEDIHGGYKTLIETVLGGRYLSKESPTQHLLSLNRGNLNEIHRTTTERPVRSI